MKPFIKPRPATPPQPEPAAPKPAASLNELTIFALAAGISDPTERTAYLDQMCGADAALKTRLQQRLAARLADIPVPPAPTAERRIESALLSREPSAKDSPALALVPVSAMQFPALPPQLQRQVTFAWGSATLMALAVGALAVIFYFEKDARVRAEGLAKEATGAAEQSLRDRESSEARARETAAEAQRTADARDKAEAERDASALKAAAAAQETERLRTEADKQRAELNNLRTSTEEKSKAEKRVFDKESQGKKFSTFGDNKLLNGTASKDPKRGPLRTNSMTSVRDSKEPLLRTNELGLFSSLHKESPNLLWKGIPKTPQKDIRIKFSQNCWEGIESFRKKRRRKSSEGIIVLPKRQG